MAEVKNVREVRQLILEGWELWYIARRDRSMLPGNWHMRYKHQQLSISWELIERIRKNLKWWSENTEEIEMGRNWVYRLKQRPLL